MTMKNSKTNINHSSLMMTMKKNQKKTIKKFKIAIKNSKITTNQPFYFNDNHKKIQKRPWKTQK